MKILLTGAHFTTALAVIEELKQYPKMDLVYVGRRSTMENVNLSSAESNILPQYGVKFISITTGKLQKSFSPLSLLSLLKIPIGILQSTFIILKEKPDVVLSFGGYVAVPVVFVSWLFSVPIMIHEQTLVTGLANKVSSSFADKIAVSFDTSYDFDKSKVILTGNPIRKDLVNSDKSPSNDISLILKEASKSRLPILYITGGNQGAHALNEVMSDCIKLINQKVIVIHQTGDSLFHDFEKLTDIRNNLRNPERYLLRKWVDVNDLSVIFKKTDFVLSRAGANTLTELSFFGIPAIVVPYPHLRSNEQMKNAQFFEKLGLVKIIPQSKFNQKLFMEVFEEFLKDLEALKRLAHNSKKINIPDSEKRIALETYLLGLKSGGLKNHV